MRRERGIVAALLGVMIALAMVACGGAKDPRERALRVARDVMNDEDISVYDRMIAAGVLYWADEDEGRAFLEDRLANGSTFEQRAAVTAALTNRAPEALKFVQGFASNDPALEVEILQVLRSNPRADGRGMIEEGLRSGEPGPRIASLDAAATTGDESMLAAVEQSMRLPGDSRMFAFGVYAMSALGSPRLDLIEPLAASEFPSDREIAAASLAHVDSAWSRRALEKLVADELVRVRTAAAASLAQLGEAKGREELIAIITGDDAGAAQVAAGALRRVPAPTIASIAAELSGHPKVHGDAAARVVESLGFARSEEAGEMLSKAVAAEDEIMQLQGLWAIGWRGRSDEIPIALGALESGKAAVRAMASWAVVYALDGGGSQI